MTLNLTLPPDMEAKLREWAFAAGEPIEVYASEVLTNAVNSPTIDELLAPVRAQFAQSGMSEQELMELGRRELRAIRKPGVANMSIEIRPELQTFIEDQVKAGRFPSARAAVEEAVEQMRLNLECSQLTEEDIKAIEESDAQIDRGEYVDFRDFAARMRKKYCAE